VLSSVGLSRYRSLYIGISSGVYFIAMPQQSPITALIHCTGCTHSQFCACVRNTQLDCHDVISACLSDDRRSDLRF